MKRPLLLLALLFISLQSYSIIFWQPYPITATVGVNGTQQRVECSVYDSVLGSWQYYNTPYFNDSILLSASPSSIVTFITVKYVGNTWEADTIYGFIIYDPSLHQFMPQITQAKNPHYYAPAGLSVIDNMVRVSFSCCSEFFGFDADYRCYIYDIISHAWQGGTLISSSVFLEEECSLSRFKGGLVKVNKNDYDFNPYVGMYFYDPVIHNFAGIGNIDDSGDSGGDQDLFYARDNAAFGNDEIICSAFDPSVHYFNTHVYSPQGTANGHNGIFYGRSYSDVIFGIFDDSLHQWVMDIRLNDYSNTVNIIVKDKVVTYRNTAKTNVYFQVFSPSTRTWVRDSASTFGIDTLYISEGTVHWVDTSGVAFFRGYIDSIGWGNYTTPLQLNFYITNFYNATGYPLIYVRDYTIGSDSTWYTFSDGVETLPGEQNSLWHLFKMNGNYSPSFTNGQVCIHAVNSTGLHTWCGNYNPPCAVDVQLQNACSDTCNASATITNLTAIAPLSYVWSTGDTTNSALTSLCAGNYSVTVVDANGCTVHHDFHLAELSVNISSTTNKCATGCNGTVYSLASGGGGNYTYQWSTGDTSNGIANLCAGIYTLTVTDANQCQVSDSVTMSNPVNPFQLINAINNSPKCDYDWPNDYYLSYEFSNGIEPFTISTVGAIYDTSYNNGTFYMVFWNMDTTIYSITVTDGYGCSITMVDTIFPPPIFYDVITHQNPTCSSCNDGMIVAKRIGGIAPAFLGVYPFYLGTVISGDTIYNLDTGVYHVYIDDAGSCEGDYWDTLTAVTSIDEHNLNNLIIQPNPASSYFNIVLPDSEKKYKEEQIQVYNSIGEQINVDMELKEKHIKVNSKNLNSGIYLIRLLSNEHIFVGRLIIE